MSQVVAGERTTTIVSDSYAPFGTVIVGGPAPVERDFDAERKADRIGYAEILKMFKWTDQDFERARDGFRFPSPTGRILAGPDKNTCTYSRERILSWRDDMRSFLAKVR